MEEWRGEFGRRNREVRAGGGVEKEEWVKEWGKEGRRRSGEERG